MKGRGGDFPRLLLGKQEAEPKGLISGGGQLLLSSLVSLNASTSAPIAGPLPVPLALFSLIC